MSLLDPGIIETIYSKQEYADHIGNIKTSASVSLYPLHYQIALNFSQSACADYASQHKECLASQDSRLYFLTPLMLAILLEKKELVGELARWMAQEDFRATDAFGFTALHLASIALPSAASLLERKSDLSQLTPWKGSSHHLAVLAGHIPSEKPRCRFQVMDRAGKLRDGASLSLEELRSLTGLRELREVALYDNPEGKRFLWQRQKPLRFEEEFVFESFFEPKLKAYSLSPPKLTVKPSPKLSLLEGSLGLFVDEETAPFTKLAGYGGRFQQSSEESFYVLGMFDGKDIGGLATLVNCGFPNSVFIGLHYEGDEHNNLFSARTLSPGEEILVSYGFAYTPLKVGRQILLGVDEMEIFFKNFNRITEEWIDLIEEIATPETTLQKLQAQFKGNFLSLQALFPLYFPNYLLHLWAKGITPAEFWLDALDEDNSHPIYQNSRMELILREDKQIKSHCKILSALDALEKTDQWGYVTAFKNWALERIGKFTYTELVFAALLVKKGFQNKQLNGDNFQSFFQKLAAEARKLVIANCEGKLLEFLNNAFRENPL